MYRLLIVDDEPIIVNGLVDFFAQQEQWDLDIFGAHSAEEALVLLKHHRIDIVITDIGMPQVDGLELQKRIVQHWPRCKLIFLTGFNDFAYIQEAIRNQGFDYVLKAEGDEVLLRAVEKAIEQMSEEIRKEQLLIDAEKQLQMALPSLQKELLQNILLRDMRVINSLSAYFTELQFPLEATQPLLLILVRVDNFKVDYSIYDRSLMIYSILNVAQEYLQVSVQMISVELDHSRMLWFIQPTVSQAPNSDNTEQWTDTKSFVKGSLEFIQHMCKEILGTPLSFVMLNDPIAWAEVSQMYEQYMRKMSRGLGMGPEILWIYEKETELLLDATRMQFNSHHLKNQLDLLRLHLLNGHKESFDIVLSQIMLEGTEYAEDPLIQQEIYYSLVPLFLSHMNLHLSAEFDHQTDIRQLTVMDSHGSWVDISAFFHELSTMMFTESKDGMEQEESIVIQKIRKYIRDNLDGDISLYRIGTIIGYNSKYLSRLYKKSTGEDLSAFISRTKLSEAQSMLKETNLKIYEVSSAIGFLSEPYFYRFFRKATGMTPQEYRDMH